LVSLVFLFLFFIDLVVFGRLLSSLFPSCSSSSFLLFSGALSLATGGPLSIRSSKVGPSWKMIASSALFSIISLLVLAGHCGALKVAPGSACVDRCAPQPAANSSRTASTGAMPAEPSCFDPEFSLTLAGKGFKDCVTCESKSARVDEASGENDLYSFLC
jgi:hypothetical protein